MKDKKFVKYEELIDEKAIRRDKKKTKKMLVHSSGLHEIWKLKTDKSPSTALRAEENNDNNETG
jgi:hypothetical protein